MGGATGHVGTNNVAVLHKVLASNANLGAVPNAHLASALGREYHPPDIGLAMGSWRPG